mmetsp:Transcript_6242/g.26523  ORF Transcript_6242/g.26523 Transcript_6242/m.26523 type:complete len:232 (-) Transcript_6242:539-1234(-)
MVDVATLVFHASTNALDASVGRKCKTPVLKLTCEHPLSSFLSATMSMQSVDTSASATAYEPVLKYKRGSLSHVTSASVKIGATPISSRSCTNLVFTVPIFLNDASPAVIKDLCLFFNTELPFNNIVGTPRFTQKSLISSSSAPTKTGFKFNASADFNQLTTKSFTDHVANVTNNSSPGRTILLSSLGMLSSFDSSSEPVTATAAVFSLHMSRIHFGWSFFVGSTCCMFTTP